MQILWGLWNIQSVSLPVCNKDNNDAFTFWGNNVESRQSMLWGGWKAGEECRNEQKKKKTLDDFVLEGNKSALLVEWKIDKGLSKEKKVSMYMLRSAVRIRLNLNEKNRDLRKISLAKAGQLGKLKVVHSVWLHIYVFIFRDCMCTQTMHWHVSSKGMCKTLHWMSYVYDEAQ